VAWVSENARSVWLPRFEAVAGALATMELRSVAEGFRAAALRACAADGLVDLCRHAAALGLVAHPFDRRQLPLAGEPSAQFHYRPERPFAFAVLVTKRADLARLQEEIEDPSSRASLLGAPACCAGFVAEACRDGWLDPTWPMALKSGPLRDLVVDLASNPGSNTLLRPIGIYPVFHSPCSFGCPETVALWRGLGDLGRGAGLAEEMSWLEEILSWPTLWSALHGIAEIKNPVLRLVTTTDATGEKLEIRTRSDRYPTEGARGIHFPYRDASCAPPADRPLLQIIR